MPIPPAFLEPLFQALTLDLLIPATSAFPQAPKKTDHHALQTWFDDLCVLETRDTAFLGECKHVRRVF
jgi:hypothetical protein